MGKLSSYVSLSVDWRKQLQSNDRRSHLVILVFILIYITIGLIIDLYIHPELDQFTIVQSLKILLTFKIIPVATLILGTIAIFSILITYSLHDRIMLLGTEYHEITSHSSHSLEEQQLYHIVEELKIAASLRYLPKIYVIEADYMNAFASGYSEKSALIAVTRGLLKKLKRNELQAVIAHELNHIRHHDIKLTLMACVLSNIMLLALDLMFRSIIFGGRSSRRRDDSRSSGGIAAIIILLRFLLPIITVLLLLYLSRKREFMADAGAVELMRDNVPLAQALLKISDDHKVNVEKCAAAYAATPHEEIRREAYIFDPQQMGITVTQSIATIFSTHPSLEQRLEALGFKAK
jgi:heat shock protein HtpX